MANTFYYDACVADAKITPFPDPDISPIPIDPANDFYLYGDESGNNQLTLPHSIMNEYVAINYRTIYNGYRFFGEKGEFTEYSDYERCMSKDEKYKAFLADKKNPTYKNIIYHYNSEGGVVDPYGLASYKMQDFIYLKYYNQIPNNYMITLRRYTRPCEDHMFGLDLPPVAINAMNNYPEDYFAIATAVTYMGEKAGNKLSDIMKFDFGANWEEKDGKTESLQNSDGGLAAQLRSKKGTLTGENKSKKDSLITSILLAGKGVKMADAQASQYAYEGNAFNARYGEEFYGDVNVINKVKMRSRGVTFSNNFSLNFEYSLKSLKCVNPRVAMMDILSNFLILTGNYASFWGGATIFYGNKSIAPQYGDPDLLRQGKYGAYIKSLASDTKEGFQKISQGKNGEQGGNFLNNLWNGIKNVGSGFLQGLIGNLLGGNIGIAGEAQVVPALLSGAPSGFWHVTVGNPLDPIAMMGNMAVTKTSVQFGDALGYDDFPTEVKFTVELEHCRPRDNAGIEAMFNAGKGRFYAFTNNEIENAYHVVDSMANFQQNDSNTEQEVNTGFDSNTSQPQYKSSNHGTINNRVLSTIGGFLNG